MKKLCIVFGGASCEHDISIITAMQLKKNYNKPVEMLYLGTDNKFYLATEAKDVKEFSKKANKKFKQVYVLGDGVYVKKFGLKFLFNIECVINCCHGGVGENGDLSGFFAVNGVKFTNAGSLPSHIAMDKNLCKQIVGNEIPKIKGILVKKSNFNEKINEINENFSNFLIIKPNSLGSSIGVKCCDKSDFKSQIEAIFEMGDDVLVEERVCDIQEYNQACFMDNGKLILSAIENPITKSDFLTFKDKYENNNKTKGLDRIIPAKISKELEKKINEYTQKIYTSLNLNGVVRVDYIFDKEANILYFNEVNTIPGSMAFYLYEPIGIDYITLIDKLVENATMPKKYQIFETDILTKKQI